MSASKNPVLDSIEEQVEELAPDEVEELQLDTLSITKFTEEHKIRLESFTNLASLSLNGCNLRSLENFPTVNKFFKHKKSCQT
jgi:hypothetical protein